MSVLVNQIVDYNSRLLLLSLFSVQMGKMCIMVHPVIPVHQIVCLEDLLVDLQSQLVQSL